MNKSTDKGLGVRWSEAYAMLGDERQEEEEDEEFMGRFVMDFEV